MQILIDYLQVLNWLAVVVSALAGFATAGLWYARVGFGEQWAKGVGLTKKDIKKSNKLTPMIGGFLAIFVGALALGILIDVLHISGVFNGMLLGVLVAIGFIASTRVMHLLFELKLPEFIVITVAGDIVTFAVIGGVLTLF